MEEERNGYGHGVSEAEHEKMPIVAQGLQHRVDRKSGGEGRE